MTLLGKRYATALHLLAIDKGAADAVAGDLRAVHEALASPAARALLTTPDMTGSERARVLETLGRGRHPLVQSLFGVLHHRRRLEVLFDIAPAYHALRLLDRGDVEGVAESPHPLGEAELSSLQALAGRLSGKRVSLTVAIRPELLGGVRLRVGNVLYDASMQLALAQLEQKMLQAAI